MSVQSSNSIELAVC